MDYKSYSKEQLAEELKVLEKEYEAIKEKKLSLNMARGIPSQDQLNLSLDMQDILDSKSNYVTESGVNTLSYGTFDGIEECKKLMADMMSVEPSMVMVGGNSSLNMMFDTISTFMFKSPVESCKPWCEVKDRKFICLVPGYDRHFAVTEYFGFELIAVPLNEDGPDMDKVEELIKDESVKGMWCVPKYSNPSGITYSDETVKRIANLKPAAKDFRIIWDNAYCIHELSDTPDNLLPLWDECKKASNEDLAIFFCSTSKVTFPGSGVAAMAASENNMKVIKNKYTKQNISFDKVNMLRHVLYFKDINGMKEHMNKHKALLSPRFSMVCDKLDTIREYGIIDFHRPKGGYFVSVDVLPFTAKDVVSLCKEAGVTLTGAGATYPYKNDPEDKNIRVAPTYPSEEDLKSALDVFTICVRLAAVKKLIGE